MMITQGSALRARVAIRATALAVVLVILPLVLTSGSLLAPADAAMTPVRPRAMPAGQTQLITVQAAGWGSRTARIDLWVKGANGRWTVVAATSARLGARGLVAGQNRRQDTLTTPSGRYTLPSAFGTVSATGYRIPYRKITYRSYWCLDNLSAKYNRYVEQYPMTSCRASQSEHLANYSVYRRAIVIGYNLQQVRYRGGGIFLHDNGRGYTAGCISVDRAFMDRISGWLRTSARPTIVIGTRASILAQR
jgi:L,D-peptidoglycan transpeptidase YkuD (ErfK/YbiS/YcfS/YnhG family)